MNSSSYATSQVVIYGVPVGEYYPSGNQFSNTNQVCAEYVSVPTAVTSAVSYTEVDNDFFEVIEILAQPNYDDSVAMDDEDGIHTSTTTAVALPVASSEGIISAYSYAVPADTEYAEADQQFAYFPNENEKELFETKYYDAFTMDLDLSLGGDDDKIAADGKLVDSFSIITNKIEESKLSEIAFEIEELPPRYSWNFSQLHYESFSSQLHYSHHAEELHPQYTLTPSMETISYHHQQQPQQAYQTTSSSTNSSPTYINNVQSHNNDYYSPPTTTNNHSPSLPSASVSPPHNYYSTPPPPTTTAPTPNNATACQQMSSLLSQHHTSFQQASKKGLQFMGSIFDLYHSDDPFQHRSTRTTTPNITSTFSHTNSFQNKQDYRANAISRWKLKKEKRQRLDSPHISDDFYSTTTTVLPAVRMIPTVVTPNTNSNQNDSTGRMLTLSQQQQQQQLQGPKSARQQATAKRPREKGKFKKAQINWVSVTELFSSMSHGHGSSPNHSPMVSDDEI
jgi:hypothetical protein